MRIMWGADEPSQRLVEAAKVPGWNVKLVKLRRKATRLQTPQPQLHAAQAPWRMALLKTAGRLRRFSWENWSLQSPMQRRRELPTALRGGDLLVLLFGTRLRPMRSQRVRQQGSTAARAESASRD